MADGPGDFVVLLAITEAAGLCFVDAHPRPTAWRPREPKFLLFIADRDARADIPFWLCGVVLRYLSRRRHEQHFTCRRASFRRSCGGCHIIVTLTALAAIACGVAGAIHH